MTPFEHDIIDLHIALEAWLGKGEGEADALLARFQRDFLMIPPGGVQELTTIQSGERGAVLHYRETQTRPDLPVNVRWSTAVLNQEGDKITWRLLHETATQP